MSPAPVFPALGGSACRALRHEAENPSQGVVLARPKNFRRYARQAVQSTAGYIIIAAVYMFGNL